MSRERKTPWMAAVLGQLGWPIILGLAATTVFYALLLRGPLNSPETMRYFASHPVSFCATGMFFVGLAALLLKAFGTVAQFGSFNRTTLGLEDRKMLPPVEAEHLLGNLNELPAPAQQSYLGRRLRAALEYIVSRGSAEGLDDELKYLADGDAAQQQDSYALARIIIWATPMLGFLGTVVGITQALGDLDPTELATSVQTAMDKLLAGLYVAFDTTALALTLSIILMFIQFLVDRLESQLLGMVDRRINEELRGRFEELGTKNDPYLTSVERMGQAVIKTSDVLVKQQVQIWQQAMEDTTRRWDESTAATAQTIQQALSGALSESLQQFQQSLVTAEREAAEKARRRWEQWQTSLSENSRLLHSHQQELARQGETLGRVLEATGSVIKLEEALNENLRSLAGANNFEETVMSLSAAIHLLNTRLGQAAVDVKRVELKSPDAQGRAA